MDDENQENQLNDLLDRIKVTDENRDNIERIRESLDNGNFTEALNEIKKLQEKGNIEYIKREIIKSNEDEDYENFIFDNYGEQKKQDKISYPGKLGSTELEKRYIGIVLNDVKDISVYFFMHKECYFADDNLLNIYKQILFTDGEKYAPEAAKSDFNFAKETEEIAKMKFDIKSDFENTNYKIDKTYTELKKIFTLRKNYLGIPVKHIQEQIADILNYELYDKMTVDEVESAVEQVTVTEKFKRAVLNDDLTGFLLKGDNTLTNGLELPFPILTSVFKGIRQGETMAFAMPSNAGKSRFTINIAAYVALVHKKKVLLISNEMSEEKMKLCLITTIINNPVIQKLHGHPITVSEGELLEFKFKPDEGKQVEVDEKGYVLRNKGEKQEDFAKRLLEVSSIFKEVTEITNWFNMQMNNSIYFINITDHTNDELKKVIMNYYYKEKVEYVFYDTLKTDIENIGNGEELKKTATVLANLAQNFNMYVGSTLQLAETITDPVNLTVNDLAVSRTVKEVLDTLCLFKQIFSENYGKYEYSINEVDTKFFDLKHYDDPDVRYYSCVVDKNRAGAKPKVLFKLNLAYNRWEEMGYLRLKNS